MLLLKLLLWTAATAAAISTLPAADSRDPTRVRTALRTQRQRAAAVRHGADCAALQASDMTNYRLRVGANDPAELGVDDVRQYSGYLDDEEQDKHLFYWFFESRNDPINDPVVLWLNGGPGCSSLTGLFMELGPAKVNKNLQLERNPYSWNANASVIFLDQPVNVGFSHSRGSVNTTAAASKDVYALLSLFFDQFPEYAHQDFHIAGESYAGHYIPVFAAEILAHPDRNINLVSALIGNGLTDPLTQYAYYRPMACGEGGYDAVLTPDQCRAMDAALPRCEKLIRKCQETGVNLDCLAATGYCNVQMLKPYQDTGRNPYDIRTACQGTSGLCYDAIEYSTRWLNQRGVMDALGVDVVEYKPCNKDINMRFAMAGDWMKPIQECMPAVLDQIPVMVYAGDADFICNWLGNRAWTEALDWSGHRAFHDAPLRSLAIAPDTTPWGQVKAANGFAFVQVYGAGHMVPLDQPRAALDMLNRWLCGEWR